MVVVPADFCGEEAMADGAAQASGPKHQRLGGASVLADAMAGRCGIQSDEGPEPELVHLLTSRACSSHP
jgi:hypothetical protein